MQINKADKLIENIIKTKNPCVVGLDPDLKKIPDCYKNILPSGDGLADVADVILEFNRDIIDTLAPYIPAVKPQMAFYEKYGHYGVQAFEKTVEYAHEKGLAVIEDGKRNDIGNTARAYADGHLGLVETLNGDMIPSFDADFLTVSPFLGSESLTPFVEICEKYGKGIFVLIKTSNSSSGEIQDVVTEDGRTISQTLAEYTASQAEKCIGIHGYSPIGAVVGATYPDEAAVLRKMMPNSCFLVPGYGAQGGSAGDIVPCFNPDGLGAIVNSSRGILYSHISDAERKNCTKKEYLNSVLAATQKMQNDIYTSLRANYPDMVY